MPQSMTRKQALAVLHIAKPLLYESASYLDNEPLRKEVLEAFSVLARAIHGKPPTYRTALCDRCHLDYGSHWVEYLKEDSWQGDTRCWSLCPSCLEQVKPMLTIVSLDWEPVESMENVSLEVVSAAAVESNS